MPQTLDPTTEPTDLAPPATTETINAASAAEPSGEAAESPPVEEKIRVFLELNDSAALAAVLKARRQHIGDAAFEANVDIQNSYDNVLATLITEHSNESDRIRAAVAAVENPALFDGRLTQDGKTILGSSRPHRAPGNGAVVSGTAAKAAFAMRSGYMKRVPLYNSGFSIDIIQPSLSALNSFFNKANDATNTYGRQFGAHFYYFNDLMIKQAVVDLVMPLILNSTLKHWNRGTTLLRHIKLMDLKLILNAIGALLFPTGFTFTHVCTNPAGTCTHHEEALIDINKLVKHDYGKLSTACRSLMASPDEISPDSLTDYHSKLGFDGREVRYKQYGLTLQVPSLDDYLSYGKVFNDELLGSIFVDNPNALGEALIFAYYRVYAPFVARVTLYNPDGTPDLINSERDLIAHILSQIQTDDHDHELIKQFDQFIVDSEISHICYPAGACPECGYVPGSGYYTVDPEHAFFIQSLMKLRQS